MNAMFIAHEFFAALPIQMFEAPSQLKENSADEEIWLSVDGIKDEEEPDRKCSRESL
jgi:hypothetical protein